MSRLFSLLPLTALALPVAHAGEVERISQNAFQVQGNDDSFLVTLSGDGGLAAMSSDATNLAGPGDTNGQRDIFLRDQETGVVTRINLGPTAAQADGFSECPVISADGNVVVYGSWATTILNAPNNSYQRIHLHDVATGTTELVSVNSAGTFPNEGCSLPTVSADGSRVAYFAIASDIAPGFTTGACFVRDRTTGTTIPVTVDINGGHGTGLFPNISADGRYVAFQSQDIDLVAGDGNGVQDMFRFDIQTGITELVSVASSGQQANGQSASGGIGVISGDGRFVVFDSIANNLVPNDGNFTRDIFVRDMATQTTERVSVSSTGVEANAASTWAVISVDGRFVAFESTASNLVPGDTNNVSDVFVHDRQTGRTIRVSESDFGVQGNAGSFAPAVSGDGRHIGFYSVATNLAGVDNNNASDLFVHSQCWVSAESVGVGFAGTGGIVPELFADSGSCFPGAYRIEVRNVVGGAVGFLFAGTSLLDQFPVLGAHFYVDLGSPFVSFPVVLSGTPGVAGDGGFTVSEPDLHDPVVTSWIMQFAAADPGAALGVSMTNPIELHVGE